MDDEGHLVKRDEAAARRVRTRARRRGLSEISRDRNVDPHLGADERLLDRRARAALTRIADDAVSSTTVDGAVYLTDRRLLHLDGTPTSIPLEDIDELAISSERLLITVRASRGVILEVDSPRQFRSKVAAAISALRGAQQESR